MQIKSTVSYHNTLITMLEIKYSDIKFWQGCGEMNHAYTAGGNVKWHTHSGKLWNLKTKYATTYDATIALLDIYSKNWRRMFTHQLTEEYL